jgi:hypothetical protein
MPKTSLLDTMGRWKSVKKRQDCGFLREMTTLTGKQTQDSLFGFMEYVS